MLLNVETILAPQKMYRIFVKCNLLIKISQMKNKIIGLACCLILILSGCSVEKKLNRSYKGKSQQELLLEMGRPTRIETTAGGRSVHIYEKSKFLKPAPINTGAFQYDKFESPKSIKTEIVRFYMSPSGVIENVKLEVTYAR